MMQFIYQLKLAIPTILTEGPTPEQEDILQRHVAYLTQLANDKVVELAGRTQVNDESCFGIVIFEAENQAEAGSIMRNDPAVKEGIMIAALFPFKVAVSSQQQEQKRSSQCTGPSVFNRSANNTTLAGEGPTTNKLG